METIRWEVKIDSPPKAIRYCAKCARKTEHVSAGLFRVNAQQKQLDIWLIYKCAHCKTTWNLAIYSRVHPASVGQDLRRFYENDGGLAKRYAMDEGLLNRCGAQTEEAALRVEGPPIDWKQNIRIEITPEYSIKSRVERVIREKMALSRKEFNRLVDEGKIVLQDGGNIRTCKLQGKRTVEIRVSAPK